MLERMEVATLRALAEKAAASSDLLFVEVAGEPGSGRTSVLSALDTHLREAGWTTFWLEAYPGRGSTRRSLPDFGARLTEGLAGDVRESMTALISQALQGSEKVDPLFREAPVPELPPSVVDALRARLRTRPVAFLLDDGQHAESLLWQLLSRVVAALHGRPRMVVAVTGGMKELPPGFEEVAIERVELAPLGEQESQAHAGLGAVERELLEVAAVSGSGVDSSTLERLGLLAGEDLEGLQRSLEARGILRRSYPRGRLKLVFRTETERRIVYEEMDREKRRLLHGRFAKLEEEDLDLEDMLALLGRHLIESGDVPSGVEKILHAGRRLVKLGRVEEARRLFEEVERRGHEDNALVTQRLHAVEELAGIERRTGSAAVEARQYERVLEEGSELLGREDRVRLLRKLSLARVNEGRLDEAARLLGQAQQEIGGTEDAEDIVVEQALLLDLTARLQDRRGDLTAAASANKQSLAAAQRTRSERLLGTVHRTAGWIRKQRGELHEALAEIESARRLFERAGDAASYARACNEIGLIHSDLGDTTRAIAEYRAALRINEALSDLGSVVIQLNNLGTMHSRQGEIDEAEKCYLECVRIGERMTNLKTVLIAKANLASIAHQRGRPQQSIALADEAIAIGREIGDRPLSSAARLMKVGALRSMGRLAEVLALGAELEAETRATGSSQGLAWALRSHATSQLTLGDFDRAEKTLIEALRLSQEHDLASEEKGCLDGLARLEMERGNLALAEKYMTSLALFEASDENEERELELLEIELRQRQRPDEVLGAEDRARLVRIAEEGDARLRALASRLLAEGLPPEEALVHAERAYAIHKERGELEDLWRLALILARIEKKLGREEGSAHLEEARQIVLSIANELTEDQRKLYLGSFGRRGAL